MKKVDILKEEKIQNIINESIRQLHENANNEGSWHIWDWLKGAVGGAAEGGSNSVDAGKVEDAIEALDLVISEYSEVLDKSSDKAVLMKAKLVLQTIADRVGNTDKYLADKYRKMQGNPNPLMNYGSQSYMPNMGGMNMQMNPYMGYMQPNPYMNNGYMGY